MGLRRPRPLRAVRRLSAVLLGSPAGPPCASSSSSEERRRVPLPGHFPGWPWPTAWAGAAGPPAPWGQVGGTPAATLWALPPWRSRPGGARGRQPGQPPVPRPSFVAFAAGRRAAPGGTRPAPPPRCPAARSGAGRCAPSSPAGCAPARGEGFLPFTAIAVAGELSTDESVDSTAESAAAFHPRYCPSVSLNYPFRCR